MSTVEHLEALRHSLHAARKLPRGPLISEQYATGINDGIDVALRLIALEIQIAGPDEAPATTLINQPPAPPARTRSNNVGEASKLDFEPGSKWRMRGGDIATVYGSKAGTEKIIAYWGDRMSVFSPDGSYWFHDEESEFDLIEPTDAGLADEVAA